MKFTLTGTGRPRRAARILLLGALAAAGSCLLVPAVASALPTSFGTNGARAGQISTNTQGIAVEQESGDVYVADTQNLRIDKFGPEGEFLLAWGWGVADGESKELQTCTTTCFKGLEGAGAGQFFQEGGAEGIAVNNDPLSSSHGDVYVVDPHNNRVQKFGPQGEFLLMFGGEVNATTKGNVCSAGEACQAGVKGSEPGQFEGLTGRSIAVDSEGTVYVGDRNRVQRFSGAGIVESPQIEFSGIGPVQNLAVDSAKDLYLRGFFQEVGGVSKYDPTGKELGTPRDEAGFGEALTITIGPADELFLNDFEGGHHHILSFNAEGEQTASFDRGQLEQDGLAIAYSNHTKALYILNAGAVRIVTSPPPGPFVLLGSESATEIEPTTARLNATVNPEGPQATECHFEYGTTTAYGKSTPEEALKGAAFEDQPVSAPIKELQPSTTYHFRVVCENAAKEATEGPDKTFTTLPAVSIDQTSASEVNATSARLEAELNPHGVQSEYRFEYDTTPYVEGRPPHGVKVPIPDGDAGSTTTDTTVSNLIQELLPSTAYHYRVIAHNALNKPGEVVEGPDHTFTTQSPASILADGRIWEQVSPPNTHGSPLEPITEEGGLLQAAANGGGMAYVALGPVNEEPKGVRSPHDSQLLSLRGPSGWSTQDISTPHEEIATIFVGKPSEYQFFAEDLHAGVVEPFGSTRLDPENPANTERTPYRREATGSFVPLVTAANVPAGTKFGGEEPNPGSTLFANGVEFVTATPDLSRIVLKSPQVLATGFKPGFEPTKQNLYELAVGSLTLLSVLPNGEPASEAGLTARVGDGNVNVRGAISSDGNRVVFETTGTAHDLYLRDTHLGQTVQLDVRQHGAAGGNGSPTFQAASSDGRKVFFTDDSQLTADATAKQGQPDLYMCEVGESSGHLLCTLSNLSVDPNAGEAANVHVQGGVGEVSAIDASGGHVYFAASGVLTSAPNAHGEVAVPGSCKNNGEASCNLYEYDTSAHQVKLVAVLSGSDSPDWAGGGIGNLGHLTARSSPNGRYFTFMSQRSLTGYDNRDARSGQRDEGVFLFDSQSGRLSCVSCNPTGARPRGVFDKPLFPGLLVDYPHTWFGKWLAGSIPGWTLQKLDTAIYQSRYLSNSGRTFFNSPDALVPQDTNNVMDVYEFEPPGVGDCTTSSKTYSPTSGGCVSLISSGSSKEESAFLDASESGDEVFFLTASRLLGSDVDGAFDVYDAHVCSSSSPCPPPPPPPTPACEGDSCQHPSPPPSDQTPGSLTYKGPENPPSPAPPAKPKPPTQKQLLAKALKACKKKHSKHRRVACERQAHKRYGAKKASAKRAGHATQGTVKR
jgi:hypothetical protein